MKKLLFISFCVVAFSMQAQTFQKDSIIGFWKVEKIEKAPKNAGFKSVIDGYKKATFHFKKDSTVVLETKSPNKIFSYILKSVNASKWKATDSTIAIGSKANKYTTMMISVIKKDSATFFNLSKDEKLPMVLKVIKIKK